MPFGLLVANPAADMRSRPGQARNYCAVGIGNGCGAGAGRAAYAAAMFHSIHLDENRYPVRMRWLLAALWVLILAKCVVVWWAIGHWNVPIHPAWVIVPTLLFAAVATGIWLTAHDD